MNCSQSQSRLAATSAKSLAKDFPWPQKDMKSVILLPSQSCAGSIFWRTKKVENQLWEAARPAGRCPEEWMCSSIPGVQGWEAAQAAATRSSPRALCASTRSWEERAGETHPAATMPFQCCHISKLIDLSMKNVKNLYRYHVWRRKRRRRRRKRGRRMDFKKGRGRNRVDVLKPRCSSC